MVIMQSIVYVELAQQLNRDRLAMAEARRSVRAARSSRSSWVENLARHFRRSATATAGTAPRRAAGCAPVGCAA
jgi:hypothetical protein